MRQPAGAGRWLGLAGLAWVAGCGPAPDPEWNVPGRWYVASQVSAGRELFVQHCAECHGDAAAGTPDWKTPDAEGFYPPPPLDGSAHAWHHPLPQLLDYIADGGAAVGGRMPAFRDVLSDAEQHAVVAYFQSLWSAEIYARWSARNYAD